MNNLKQCKNAKRSTRNRHTGVINAHKERILEAGDPIQDSKGKDYTLGDPIRGANGKITGFHRTIVRGRGV